MQFFYLFAAFAVTWIAIFGYTLSLGSRLSKLEEDLRLLKKAAS